MGSVNVKLNLAKVGPLLCLINSKIYSEAVYLLKRGKRREEKKESDRKKIGIC